MITDMMDVHNVFMAAHENHVTVASAVVPVRFFNAQPKLKHIPVYPEIVIQIFDPKPGSAVWVSSTEKIVGPDVEITPAPEAFVFSYQVSGYSSRFDHAVALYEALHKIFPLRQGQRWIEVGGVPYEMTLIGVRDLPQIDEGSFETVFSYEIFVPIQMLEATTAKIIVEQSFNIDQAR